MSYHRPRIIPCLLLDGGDMVKTKKFRDPRYLGDPINAVRLFNNKGVDELCVLDISATRLGKAPDLELLRAIASEAFMPLSYGGGITSMDTIRRLFACGYEKLALNTALVDDPALVREAASYAGSSGIIASIDCKLDLTGRYRCYTNGGTRKTALSPVKLAQAAQELGAGEILLSAMHRDGTMAGYDIPLIRSVSRAVDIPVTAVGGAGSIQDLSRALHEGGAHAAAAGSLFVYYGKLRAVLIQAPSEEELILGNVYEREDE